MDSLIGFHSIGKRLSILGKNSFDCRDNPGNANDCFNQLNILMGKDFPSGNVDKEVGMERIFKKVPILGLLAPQKPQILC